MSALKAVRRLLPLALLCWLAVIPRTAWSQSFDCRQAQSDTEWAICSTPALAALDDRLAATYRKLTGPEATSPAVKKDAEQMQEAWLHGRRDVCGGNVDCLMKAYQEISDALSSLPFQDAARAAAEKASIVPHCGDPSDPMKASPMAAGFASVVCGDPHLLATVRQIETQARQLQPRLTPAWRTPFDMQEAAFPQTAYECPQDKQKLAACIAKAVAQRLRDVTDFAANVDRPLFDCKPSEVSLKRGEVGDAGMSQALDTYLIEYHGATTCRVRGYPAIQVVDAKGKPQPTLAVYSGRTYFTDLPGPPLPVTLSPQNNQAWFGIHTATACDPPYGLTVKVALPVSGKAASPVSRTWLETLHFPHASCPVTVTPISMISTLLSSVH